MNGTDLKPVRLTLGPNPYFWDRKTTLNFYTAIAETDVDTVYLGETVCSKRRAMRLTDWLALGRDLCSAGKTVVLSTLCLIEAESEMYSLKRIVENGEFPIEANDMAAVEFAANKVPFVAGPHINTYNRGTLELMKSLGALGWVMPVELSRQVLIDMFAADLPGLFTEVLAFGRLPLSISARCFTARAANTGKDQCELRCSAHPDGLLVQTQDQYHFLNINGVQVQSAATVNLLAHFADLKACGVNALRVSPQSHGTREILQTFRCVLDGNLAADEGAQQLEQYCDSGVCNGYWHGKPGLDTIASEYQYVAPPQ